MRGSDHPHGAPITAPRHTSDGADPPIVRAAAPSRREAVVALIAAAAALLLDPAHRRPAEPSSSEAVRTCPDRRAGPDVHQPDDRPAPPAAPVAPERPDSSAGARAPRACTCR